MPVEKFDPDVGADVVFEDAVATGDLVILVPRPDRKIAVKRLHHSMLDSFTGRVFQIGLGAPHESVSIQLLREAKRPGARGT